MAYRSVIAQIVKAVRFTKPKNELAEKTEADENALKAREGMSLLLLVSEILIGPHSIFALVCLS
jgi:hypothetical protein